MELPEALAIASPTEPAAGMILVIPPRGVVGTLEREMLRSISTTFALHGRSSSGSVWALAANSRKSDADMVPSLPPVVV